MGGEQGDRLAEGHERAVGVAGEPEKLSQAALRQTRTPRLSHSVRLIDRRSPERDGARGLTAEPSVLRGPDEKGGVSQAGAVLGIFHPVP